MAIARRLVGDEQPSQLDDKTKKHFEANEVPEALIAEYEQPDVPVYSDDAVNDDGDVYEVFDANGDIHVWPHEQTAFLIFNRNLNRWLHVEQPLGMGTISVPNQWDWASAERSMRRMSEIREMDDAALDTLYEQLETLEYAALKVLQQHYKQLSKS